jgi:hypothetical protein
VRVKYAPNRSYDVQVQYQHSFLDDGIRYMDKYRQDLSASLIFTAKPIDRVRLRARARYLWQDLSDDTYLERSLWTYVDVAYRLRLRDRVRLRYDYYQFLDDRASTLDREPNPEHWLWLEYEARF